jgi:hypothetical protein
MWPFRKERKNPFEASGRIEFEGWIRAKEAEDAIEEELCASTAAVSFLAAAVQLCPDERSGTQYLRDRDVPELIRRSAQLAEQILLDFRRTGEVVAAIDNDITLVHISWLLSEWAAASKLLGVCLDQHAETYFPQTHFWSEYYRAMDHLARQEPYAVKLPKVDGYERYWVPYLRLVEVLTNHEQTAHVDAEISQLFGKRNSEKRLIDWSGTDGDGQRPVRWDFREASIRRFWQHSQAGC